MSTLLALIGFAAVSSGSPGPNNLMLWASGAEFGFGRTGRHILGTAVGLGVMALGVAAGLGTLVTAVPELAFVMKAAGSVYLLYLAWQIAGAGALERSSLARPLGLRQAIGFQLINPKAWIFALGAITTVRPPELPVVPGSIAVALTMMVVIVPTASVWVVAGDLLGRVLNGPRTRRPVSLALAAMLAATVVLVLL